MARAEGGGRVGHDREDWGEEGGSGEWWGGGVSAKWLPRVEVWREVGRQPSGVLELWLWRDVGCQPSGFLGDVLAACDIG